MITEHGDPGTCGMPHRQLQTSDRLASLLRQCALVEEELLRQHERQKQHTAELGWLDLALMDAGIEMKRKQADGLQEQVNAHAQLRQFQHEATAAAKACAFARKCAATAAREAAQLEADNANAEAEVDAAVGHLENVRADVAALQHIYSILSDAIKRSNRAAATGAALRIPATTDGVPRTPIVTNAAQRAPIATGAAQRTTIATGATQRTPTANEATDGGERLLNLAQPGMSEAAQTKVARSATSDIAGRAAASDGASSIARLFAVAERVAQRMHRLPASPANSPRMPRAAMALSAGAVFLQLSTAGPAPFLFWVDAVKAGSHVAPSWYLMWRACSSRRSADSTQRLRLSSISSVLVDEVISRHLLYVAPSMLADCSFVINTQPEGTPCGKLAAGPRASSSGPLMHLLAPDMPTRDTWVAALRQLVAMLRGGSASGSRADAEQRVDERLARAGGAAPTAIPETATQH